MGEQYDAPNQQAVRPDGSGPWDEGDGGSGGAEVEPTRRRGRPRKTDDAETKPTEADEARPDE